MNKIIKLTSENVKRLQAVEITPKGNVIVIGGKNGAGKSSVLDSIEYALGGEPQAKMPVRRGEEKARIVVDLGELVVKRTFTAAGGSTLVVTNADGAKQLSPQTILDKMVGKLTFDPLAFARQKPTDQAETLRKLVGLDFAEHDAEARQLYDERTTVNREVKALQARLAAMPKHENAPEKEASVADVLAEQQKAAEINATNERLRTTAERCVERLEICDGEISRLSNEIENLTNKLNQLKANRPDILAQAKAAKTAAQAKDIDLSPFRQRVAQVEADNRKVRENAARAEVSDKFKVAEKKADALTRRIEALDSDRKKKTTAAKYPIEGLLFDTAGGITLNGIPFDQCSAAEQLRVSVAIGLALNPKLKVLLIRDGSLLDEESLKLITDMAVQSDAQIWLEVVSTDDQTSVVIEDGNVIEVRE